ncbi:MAG TPA: PilZ domain-containing protein [Terriglobales bacterium]|nr:PilZ domain-containing protein [Terriglobales bacterium]
MSSSTSKPDVRVRRRYPRFPLDVRLAVQVLREGEKISMWGRSNELGRDGIGATLTAGVEPGEVVWMELSLPLTAVPLRMRAIVRYRDGLRHGFEFLALSGDQRQAVGRVCEMLETGA